MALKENYPQHLKLCGAIQNFGSVSKSILWPIPCKGKTVKVFGTIKQIKSEYRDSVYGTKVHK